MLIAAYGLLLNLDAVKLLKIDAFMNLEEKMKKVGKGELQNQKLIFRNGMPSIEPVADEKVPVGIWDVDESIMYSLNTWVGVPLFRNVYKVKDFRFLDNEGNERVETVLIHKLRRTFNETKCSKLSLKYLTKGYEDWGFDLNLLKEV